MNNLKEQIKSQLKKALKEDKSYLEALAKSLKSKHPDLDFYVANHVDRIDVRGSQQAMMDWGDANHGKEFGEFEVFHTDDDERGEIVRIVKSDSILRNRPLSEISQKVFSKLKGRKVKFYGTPYTVIKADGYIVTLKDEEGNTKTANLNQFNQKGMVDEKKTKRDRCLKIADKKFKKPSAYKSGAVVRCRKGDIWKGVKESVNTLDEKKKETLRTWFGRKGAAGKTGGWVDCNTGRKDSKTGKVKYKPCGRKKGENRAKYPSCRPTPAGCKDKGKGKSWGKIK